MLLALAGCVDEQVRHAELQLDIEGADVHDEDVVRICVSEVGNLERAVGAGRIAFPGIPEGDALTVTVDVLDGDESFVWRAGPEEVDGVVSTDAIACTDASCAACRASGSRVPAGQADRVLAVRFLAL